MVQTDYHNEELPDSGGDRDQWGDILNDLLQYYDTQIELRGAKTERPSAADAPSGALYRIDEGAEQGRVYVENADSWVALPVEGDAASIASELGIPVYSDDLNAPTESLYFDSTDAQLEYKDAGGTIHSGSSGTDTRTDVSDDGTTVVSETEDINFGTDLDVTDDGDNTVTVDAPGLRRNHADAGSVGLEASGSGNNIYNIPVYLRDGWSVDWQWASLSLSDGTTDPDVYLFLVDWTGSTIDSISASSDPNIIDKTGISPLANNSGSAQTAYFRVENRSSTNYTASSSAADAVEYAAEWVIE